MSMFKRAGKLVVKECFRDRKVRVAMCETNIGKDHLKQAVVYNPDGANVLPYFFSKKRGWCVVLVKQYRIAVDAVTQEAPGGMVEGSDIRESMARELKEETGINVAPEAIEVVFKEYMLPPLLVSSAWGGIVEIKEKQIHRKSEWGIKNEYEHTSISIVPLRKFIKTHRSKTSIVLDLWTSRLVSEVVKKLKTFG